MTRRQLSESIVGKTITGVELYMNSFGTLCLEVIRLSDNTQVSFSGNEGAAWLDNIEISETESLFPESEE